MKNIMKIKEYGIPRMWDYSDIIADIINEELKMRGINYIRIVVAPKITKDTVARGCQLTVEEMCLPFKIGLGNILDLIDEKGILDFWVWSNCGDCRQKVYYALYESILRQLNVKNAKITPISPANFIQELNRAIPQISKWQWCGIVRKIFREIKEHDFRIMEKQANAPEGEPEIVVCGEIFTCLEPAANSDLVKKLQEQGAYVHNALSLWQFLFGSLLSKKVSKKQIKSLITLAYLRMWREIWTWVWARKKLQRPDINYELLRKAEKETSRYLFEHSVGGHGRDTITWLIYYSLKKVDAIIHVSPVTCAPEVVPDIVAKEISKKYNIPISRFMFDQPFSGETHLENRVEALVTAINFSKKGGFDRLFQKTGSRKISLGLDAGSTTIKAVLVEADGKSRKIIDCEYHYSNRDPMNMLKKVISLLLSRNPNVTIKHIGVTGSGRQLVKALTDTKGINSRLFNEIICQIVGCITIKRDTQTIIDIGGQDSKYIEIGSNKVPTFRMNTICSAGTGASLDSFAKEFGMSIEKFVELAQSADDEPPIIIAGRCAVFLGSEIISLIQKGYSQSQIARATCRTVVANYLHNLCHSEKLKPPIMFTGGVARNPVVEAAFRDSLDEEKGEEKILFIHPYAGNSAAFGAACLAIADGDGDGGQINSTELSTAMSTAVFNSSASTCQNCPNKCEISTIFRNGEIVGKFGSRCGKEH